MQRAGAVDYPTADGRPMGETELHQLQMIELLQALKHRYAGSTDVWVGGNLLLCYDPTNRNCHISPDAMVVFGVEPRLRDNYLLWVEKAVPSVVFEITSKWTRREDMRVKKDLYLRLGIPEYYMFDPTHDYLRPPLQGWHARGAEWMRLHGEPLRSPSLGVDLRVVDGRLRLYDTRTGELQPTEREVSEAERRRADEERQRAHDEHQRADAERRRADAERRRAEAERQQADTHRQRANAAEEEVARLRRRLAELEQRLEQA